ncbi:hypothetical protein NL676_024423 [Syzygium grande]|nr:hypothetical protein NL676_024423 [Syzygium grande]
MVDTELRATKSPQTPFDLKFYRAIAGTHEQHWTQQMTARRWCRSRRSSRSYALCSGHWPLARGGPTGERVHHRHFDPDPTPLSLYDYELNQSVSRTKYQIVRTKTDLVFPVDVACRAMQIEEVNDAKISSAFTFKPDDGELKIWSGGAAQMLPVANQGKNLGIRVIVSGSVFPESQASPTGDAGFWALKWIGFSSLFKGLDGELGFG